MKPHPPEWLKDEMPRSPSLVSLRGRDHAYTSAAGRNVGQHVVERRLQPPRRRAIPLLARTGTPTNIHAALFLAARRWKENTRPRMRKNNSGPSLQQRALWPGRKDQLLACLTTQRDLKNTEAKKPEAGRAAQTIPSL